MTDMDTAGVIGRGLFIKGELHGEEDLIIEGRVEGHIALSNHVTIEKTGQIVADISTRSLAIRGEVSGNIEAEDTVSINADAKVLADIRAPRVIIEDGARFKGRVEMDVELPDDI
jgi:cytoskeletal protein CcmA (bactofilin family)